MCPTELACTTRAAALHPPAADRDPRRAPHHQRLPRGRRRLDRAAAGPRRAGAHARDLPQVSLTRRVPPDEAARYGLYDGTTPTWPPRSDDDGLVEIPQWRHAMINFPHPLLKQGLVILDTPGLNAIGTEPELTLNLIPNAHAVLFILAAETGVTRSDIEVWRTHIGAGPGRIVVLNKIDALWDELRSEPRTRPRSRASSWRRRSCSACRRRRCSRCRPRRRWSARSTATWRLFEKSRLGLLEAALFNELMPARQDILRRQLRDDMSALLARPGNAAGTRASRPGRAAAGAAKPARQEPGRDRPHDAPRRDGKEGIRRQPVQAAGHARRVRDPVDRAVFAARHGRGPAPGRRRARGDGRPRASPPACARRCASSSRKRAPASTPPRQGRRDRRHDGIDGRRFSAEHGLALACRCRLSLERYRDEIDAIEAIWQKQFGTATLLITSRSTLLERFFDTIASRVQACLPRRQRRCRSLAEGDHGAAGIADPPAPRTAAPPPGLDPAHPRRHRQPGAEDRRLRTASASNSSGQARA
jgi:hypothetical protein